MPGAGVQLRTPWIQVLTVFMPLLITGCLKCIQPVQAPPSVSAEFNLWHTSKYKWNHGPPCTMSFYDGLEAPKTGRGRSFTGASFFLTFLPEL